MTTASTTKFEGSIARFNRAQKSLAGGVSSGLRASAKPVPIYFNTGNGSRLIDVDGNEFIDYTLAWGPLILGHRSRVVTEAVVDQLGKLQQVGAQHDLEWEVAEQICRIVPCAERVIFSNTGTEAVQAAFRLARAYTGRQKIIRFEGHYHGWMDNVLTGYRPPIENGTALLEKRPTEGMSEAAITETIVLPWNDFDAVEVVLKARGREVAALIMEPILCNSGCLMPSTNYLAGIRDLCTRFGVLLIFDEVITGFRVSLGGAQSLFGITPDLATFGKAIAGGFTLSAVAGSRDIVGMVADGRVSHAGTFNGNPICLAAARAVLGELERADGSMLESLRSRGERLQAGIRDIASQLHFPVLISGVGSVFSVSFSDRPAMRNYREFRQSNENCRSTWIELMLHSGIYLLPDGRWYLSTAHTDNDIDVTLERVSETLCTVSNRSNSKHSSGC
jgi:glutamate-1-semialdehyde 2,1-aminomutase